VPHTGTCRNFDSAGMLFSAFIVVESNESSPTQQNQALYLIITQV